MRLLSWNALDIGVGGWNLQASGRDLWGLERSLQISVEKPSSVAAPTATERAQD
jgi:hypothetical protein